jgi:hypothetical protein
MWRISMHPLSTLFVSLCCCGVKEDKQRHDTGVNREASYEEKKMLLCYYVNMMSSAALQYIFNFKINS